MNISFLIEMLFNIVRSFLFKSEKAAPYAKWLIRIRDYLVLLFPFEMYPPNSTNDAALSVMDIEPVSVEAVQSAQKKNGFNIPFIKGI